jgi:tRNA dimethylallyltransferase
MAARGHRIAVISADSMQVYRGMDIGTAKPGKELLSRLPHWLIDIRDPDEPFSVGDFVVEAKRAAREIESLGMIPVVAGGTAFYLKTLACGLPAAPRSDAAIRAEVAAELACQGPEALMAELAVADPASAARIHPNDAYRLSRAVEILRASGRPPSEFAPGDEPGKAYVYVGLSRPRDELYRRIDARVDAMMAEGLPEEVGRLAARGYGPDSPGMRAIGYRELMALRERGCGSLKSAAEEIKTNTRRYAKRQIAFFKASAHVRWIEADDADAFEDILCGLGSPGPSALQ